MSKAVQVGMFALMVLLVSGTPVMAQDGEAAAASSDVGFGAKALCGVGAGICVLGVGIGIGRIGGSAVESMARQPEVAANISTTVIITAAMIEGATFFGLLICILGVLGIGG